MTIHRNQAGFSAVEAILILVVIAILGFTGWYVWHNKQAADDAYSKAQSAQTGTSKAPEVKYLTIKEWGVRFKLPADLQDTTYKTDPGGQPVYVILSSKTIYDTTHKTLSCQTGGVEDVPVNRYKVGDPHPFSNTGEKYTQAELDDLIKTSGGKVGEYYYIPDQQNYCHENAAALETDKVAKQGSTYETELVKAVSTVELAQ